ncbi:hypothetical protein OG762_04860 [Streptomyces sp. NBC_01136]|uniref:hypothetical protein n=1 Tax=unclassified Streptomyces TaxID=2593676 RepID=UPI00324577CA|nr:hypothetical protein OG762_04860 [Streptomyces sp. NBC_01136]
MLRLDLAQEPRLLEIETNTRQCLGEAQRMQWLGEVAGLQETLRHIADKTLDQQPPAVNGQPGITVGHEGLRAVRS